MSCQERFDFQIHRRGSRANQGMDFLRGVTEDARSMIASAGNENTDAAWERGRSVCPCGEAAPVR